MMKNGLYSVIMFVFLLGICGCDAESNNNDKTKTANNSTTETSEESVPEQPETVKKRDDADKPSKNSQKMLISEIENDLESLKLLPGLETAIRSSSERSPKSFISNIIKYEGAELRTHSFLKLGEYLLFSIDFNTSGKDIKLNSNDFILVDKDNKEYRSEGFFSGGQNPSIVFSSINVRTFHGKALAVVAIFHKVPSVLGLKYKKSQLMK